MKIFVSLLLMLGLHAFAMAGSIPTVELLWSGKAFPFYGEASQDRQQNLLAIVRHEQMAERMAAVASGFRLRQNIGVGFASCGEPNAGFHPQKQAIVICTEFLELIVQEMRADPNLVAQFDPAHQGAWLRGVIWGVYFHELAHALISINRVPIAGREEDVADQFSLWYSVNFVNLTKQPIVTPMVWFWGALAKKRDFTGMSSEAIQQVLANEHSLDDQRTYNIACWALGANPEMGGRTAQFAGLPESRAARCPGEYATLNAAMRNQFVKYIRPR